MNAQTYVYNILQPCYTMARPVYNHAIHGEVVYILQRLRPTVDPKDMVARTSIVSRQGAAVTVNSLNPLTFNGAVSSVQDMDQHGG